MWWRKRKQENNAQKVVTSKLVQAWNWAQAGSVGFMQAREKRWSLLQKKVYCILFCIAAGGLSVTSLVAAFYRKTSATASLVQPIEKPLSMPRTPDPSLSKQDTLAVRGFRQWIDSLRATTRGRDQLDSLWRARPGLADSFARVEAVLFNQSNK